MSMNSALTPPTSCVLIVAHAPLASALLQCGLHIFPDCEEYARAVDVLADATPEDSLQQMLRQIAELDATQTAPVLVLTDIIGATPSNTAARLALQLQERQRQVRVVAGANVPMLVRALANRGAALDDWVAKTVDGGKLGVMALAWQERQIG